MQQNRLSRDNCNILEPIKITDSTGTVVWNTTSQKPFGLASVDEDPDGDSNDFGLNIRLPGQYYDVETGHHYNYFRDYYPGVGRYLQADPIGLKGGINLYGYVGGDPVNWVDEDGLWRITYGLSLVGIDFNGTLYNSNFGVDINNPLSNIGVSTTFVGAGFQFVFDPPFDSTSEECKDLYISMGFYNKYLGYTMNPELSYFSVNVGWGIGLPLTFSTPIQKFTEGLGRTLQKFFN